MKKNLIISWACYCLIIMVAALCLVSCSKGSDDNDDRESPLVTLTSLTDEQVFTSPQLIRISGSVTDNKYIREIHLEISDLDTGEEYLHVHIHPASSFYNYDQPYQLAAGKAYRIRVIADDASSNSSLKAVNIRCN